MHSNDAGNQIKQCGKDGKDNNGGEQGSIYGLKKRNFEDIKADITTEKRIIDIKRGRMDKRKDIHPASETYDKANDDTNPGSDEKEISGYFASA